MSFRYAVCPPNAGADMAMTRLVMYVRSRSNACFWYLRLFCETFVRSFFLTSPLSRFALRRFTSTRKTRNPMATREMTRSVVAVDLAAPRSEALRVPVCSTPTWTRSMITDAHTTTKSKQFHTFHQKRCRCATTRSITSITKQHTTAIVSPRKTGLVLSPSSSSAVDAKMMMEVTSATTSASTIRFTVSDSIVCSRRSRQ
mmetsp:Transcript_6326/g.15959  ORF Transcript_6326/g.15959 Transcript_6326/m.15959 type:complete len:200 (-) Transcript_6326:157-756(-)